MYKTGQAVIYPVGTMFFKTYGGWVKLDGEEVGLLDGGKNGKCATEAEILAEAERNGWHIDSDRRYIEGKYICVTRLSNGTWEWNYSNAVQTHEAGTFGQECITAHPLITALNLAK